MPKISINICTKLSELASRSTGVVLVSGCEAVNDAAKRRGGSRRAAFYQDGATR